MRVGRRLAGGGYSGYFAEPTWQTSNIGIKSGRAVPDVSMLGGTDPVGGVGFWVYSTASDKCGTDGSNPRAGWFGCAGTSLSTPLWAGFLAIALQVKGGSSFGNIGPLIYQVANSASYPSIFHDIVSGSNGYSANTRWDPVTGWGSPISNNLANSLAQKQVTTDKSTYNQGNTIHYSGLGFTALGSIRACLSTDNDGHLVCANPEPNADEYGNAAGTMVVGTNIPAGPQKFYVEDLTTARFSSPIQLTILAISGITFYTNPTTFTGASSPGSISACGSTFSNGQSSTNCGSSLSATANLPSPQSQWQFDHWEWSGGVSCSSNTANPTSCTISSIGSLNAVYAAQITFQTNPPNQGSISWASCSNPAYTNGQTLYDSNLPPEFSNSFTVCANVPSGYALAGWTTTGGLSVASGSNPTTTATFTGPGTITGSFTQLTQTLTTNVDSGSGSVSPNCPSGCLEGVGSSSSVTATPSANWQFSSWSITGASCSGGPSSNPCTFTMPNNAVTISATFAQLNQTLTTVVGSGNGSVSPSCSSGCYERVDSSVTVTANPSSGWKLSSWTTQNVSCSGSATSNPCTFTMPNNAVTISATFISIQNETVSTDRQTYNQGDTISFTGSGFTALGSIRACLSTDNDGHLVCISPEPNADQYGNAAGTMVVGTNIPAGPQKFYVEDLTTARFSSPIQLTISSNTTTLSTNVASGSDSMSPSYPSGRPEAVGSLISVIEQLAITLDMYSYDLASVLRF